MWLCLKENTFTFLEKVARIWHANKFDYNCRNWLFKCTMLSLGYPQSTIQTQSKLSLLLKHQCLYVRLPMPDINTPKWWKLVTKGRYFRDTRENTLTARDSSPFSLTQHPTSTSTEGVEKVSFERRLHLASWRRASFEGEDGEMANAMYQM